LFYAAKICYVDESRSAKDVFFYIIKWFYWWVLAQFVKDLKEESIGEHMLI
jgi:hypothetical protein